MSDSLRKKEKLCFLWEHFTVFSVSVIVFFLFKQANVVSFRKGTMSNSSAQARGCYLSELAGRLDQPLANRTRPNQKFV